MALVQQNFQAYLRTLRVVFIALLLGQVVVLVVLYVLRGQETPDAVPLSQNPVLKLLPIILAVLVTLGFFLYRKKLVQAQAQSNLKERLTTYRVALLLRWAFMEITIFFLGILYFLTGLAPPLYAAVFVIPIFIITQWPTRLNVVTRLGLSMDEQLVIDDPTAVVSESSQQPG